MEVDESIRNKITSLGLIVLNNEIEIDRIKNALIHIYAPWSGPSLIRTREFFNFIEKSELNKKIEIYFLYNDLITKLKYMKFLNNHGMGETIVLKEGQVMYRSQFGYPIEELKIQVDKIKR